MANRPRRWTTQIASGVVLARSQPAGGRGRKWDGGVFLILNNDIFHFYALLNRLLKSPPLDAGPERSENQPRNCISDVGSKRGGGLSPPLVLGAFPLLAFHYLLRVAASRRARTRTAFLTQMAGFAAPDPAPDGSLGGTEAETWVSPLPPLGRASAAPGADGGSQERERI